MLAASILVTMAFASLNGVETNPDSPENIYQVETAWESTQGAYAVDSLAKFVQVYAGTQTQQDVENAIKGLIKHGEYNSNQERISTYVNWSKKVQNQSGIIIDTEMQNLTVSIQNLSVKTISRFTVKTQENSQTRKIIYTKEIFDVEDPLLDNTTYSRKINKCTDDFLAKKQYEGSLSSGTVRGKAVQEPNDITTISSPDQKILVSQDITKYNQNNVQDFAGYFSQNQPDRPGDYNANYTVGTSSTPELEENQRVIIHNGFWKSNFYNVITKNCYLSSNLQETPSILERINENTRGNSNQGIYTVLLPVSSESDIGYERIDKSGLNLIEIETISAEDAWPDYRMSERLAKSAGISGLIK